MDDLEVKFLPCNCGHGRVSHVHDYPKDADRKGTWLGYCKFQWDAICPCDQYIEMTNLEYLEYRYESRAI